MKIAIIDKSNNKIVCKYENSAPNQYYFGGPWSKSNLYAHVEIPVELTFKMIAELSVIESNGDYSIEWNADELWDILRYKRNSLLLSCDWTQYSDAPLTSQQKTDWATYRQALRDLPQNTVNPASPSWPTEPS